MNLTYLHGKNHPAILVANAEITQASYNGDVWRGFRLAPSNAPQIKIREATRYHPLRSRPPTIGWYVVAGSVDVSFLRVDGSCWSTRRVLSGDGTLTPIFLPWTLTDEAHQGEYDLAIHAPQGGVIVTGTIPDRTHIVDLCKGVGVEIGPGPQPRIKNSTDVSVKYLEESSADDWKRLYSSQGQRVVPPEHWENYIIGRAHELPVSDRSLDFIFSCHVFEHLANPLGHLDVWSRKLKPGGHIVTIIPDYNATVDWLATPATVAEFLAEYEVGSFAVTREHHRRYAEALGRGDGGARSWQRGASVHVHAYDRHNVTDLLKLACERFGFREWYIVQPTNFKEFYWRLVY